MRSSYQLLPSRGCAGLLGWLAWLLLRGSSAQGQVPAAAAPPEFEQLRAEEDYRYLANPDSAVRPSVFDPLKFIALSSTNKSYLTLGGEVRQQYEYFHNTNWGEGPEDNNGYLLQRYVGHADLHLGLHVRFFSQFKSGIATGKRGGPEPPDEDRLDVHQAFVDFATREDSAALTLRLGRQEMSYGSSRLVSVREGPNVRQTFDGGRLIWQLPRWRVDGFVTRPVTTERGLFDDRPNPDQWFWGVYGARSLPKLQGGLDVYYFGFANNAAEFAQGLGRERRHSVGARYWSQAGSFRFNAEAVYQFGQFDQGRIQAATASAELEYDPPALPLHPHFSLRTEAISGDRDSAQASLQTFNPLFPKGAYFGQVALIGPANLLDLHPIVVLRPLATPDVTLTVDWVFFWRASRADGLYTVPYVLTRSPSGAPSRYIGDQRTIEVAWQVNRHFTAELFVTYFRAGPFLRESGTGRNLTYVAPRLTFLF
ncbi:alginate export family protein [uncultured Hymenobacter sp.]|uniref:alginate export family protein n=1 Tax=uncultured Hymenobacter sp. TaxID=170016 RepID=UPI0035CA2D05